MKLIRPITLCRIAAVFAAVLLTGCATWNELNDPWLRSERIDFSTHGALLGKVTVTGFEADKWRVGGYIKDLETGKRTPLQHAWNGFFLILEPGTYQMHLLQLQQTIHGYYTEVKQIKLDIRSQAYEIAAGEAVYAGDIYVGLGQPSELDLKDMATWVGMAFGHTQRGLQIGYGVKDLSYQKLEMLKQRHLMDDFDYKIQIAELKELS